MSTEALEAALRELHEHGEDAPASLPGEQAAMRAFEAKFGAQPDVPSPSRRSARGWRGWTQAAAAVACLAVIVGACSLPASYDVDLGVGLTLNFDPAHEPPFEAIANYAKEELGATDINVSVHVLDAKQGRLSLRIWGQQLGPDEVVEQLRADFPELETLDIETQVLEGKVETNLGGKLWHEMFDSAVAEDDLEVARERLLMQLLASGIDGEVDVQMREVDGHREIRVGVKKELGSAELPGQLEEALKREGGGVKLRHVELIDSDEGSGRDGQELREEVVEIEARIDDAPGR